MYFVVAQFQNKVNSWIVFMRMFHLVLSDLYLIIFLFTTVTIFSGQLIRRSYRYHSKTKLPSSYSAQYYFC